MVYVKKADRFNKVLQSAKKALDSIGVPFHLHAGTALGAHREKTFIKHDHDIDLGVFHWDAGTKQSVAAIKKSMRKEGFEVEETLGKLARGYEIQFSKDDIPLDIFWVYEGEYRGDKYYTVSSYFGDCDNLKYRTCVWGYRPYTTVTLDFLGEQYESITQDTLEDMYGKDWRVPKKFSYHEGINSGGYTGLIRDYYSPKPTDQKVAFCFLLYDRVIHEKKWVDFFNQDKDIIKSYTLYSHIKEVTDKTPKWIIDAKVEGVKTEYCTPSLVWAHVKMLIPALKNPDNKYFALLSGEGLPLLSFKDTIDKIRSTKKSRMDVDTDTELTDVTGFPYASQWCILNREHAQLLVDLFYTEKGRNFIKTEMKQVDEEGFCADEAYPLAWFMHHYGKLSSPAFKANFIRAPVTFTEWPVTGGSPYKLNPKQVKKLKRKMCSGKSIFARKFTKPGAKIAYGFCS